MDKSLNINKISHSFRSWRVAYAYVVGGKNTNNGWLRLLPKWNTNKGKKYVVVQEVREGRKTIALNSMRIFKTKRTK